MRVAARVRAEAQKSGSCVAELARARSWWLREAQGWRWREALLRECRSFQSGVEKGVEDVCGCVPQLLRRCLPCLGLRRK